MQNVETIDKFIDNNPDVKQAFEEKLFQSPAIFVGNGLTRLALSNSPSWDQWIKELWDDIDPEIPFEYMQLRDVTLPECISYLYEQTKNDSSNRRNIFHKLWNYTEKPLIPEDIDNSPTDPAQVDLRLHAFCVDKYEFIFTTNYDTLFEWACKKRGYNVQVYEFTPKQFNREKISLRFGKSDSRTIKLIKLHGTFPIKHIEKTGLRPTEEKIFNNWYDDKGPDDLVAGVTQYSKTYRYNTQKLEDFEETLRLTNRFRSLFFLGYGMKSEDDIVIQIATLYQSLGQIAMTYGGDAIDTLRYQTNWRIPHLSLPAEHGGGKNARMQAHFDFLKYFLVDGDYRPSRENICPQGIMVGQTNYVHVIRTAEAPTQERSYRIKKGKFSPDSTSSDTTYEVDYVAGQILTPAIFLDRWNIKTRPISFIGYDIYGLKIREQLFKKPNIDWSNLIQDKHITTDHSVVITHDGVRTLFDSVDSSKYYSFKGTFKDVLSLIENKEIIPSFIYLSKWYLEEVSHGPEFFLKKWISAGNYPLVCYETGSKGSESTENDKEFHLESEIGKYCDVMLASSLYVMRVFRMPICNRNKDIVYRDFVKKSLREYDEIYTKESPEGYSNRAHQNISFVIGLWNLTNDGSDINLFINNLFNCQKAKTEFSKVSWWVVTLGDLGMVAFSKCKDNNGCQGWWFKAPKTEKNEIVNALGCGDASRAGFLGYYANEIYAKNASRKGFNIEEDFLKDCCEVKNAVKCAVYVGTEKIKYFNLEDAVKNLPWNIVIKDSVEQVEVFDLNIQKNMKLLYDQAISNN